jgi:hypothetical protein
LTTVVNAMLTIANTKQLQDGIRQLGLEFLVTLAEQRAGMVRKVPNFVQNLVPVVLNFMLDIEEDPEWGAHDVRSLSGLHFSCITLCFNLRINLATL